MGKKSIHRAKQKRRESTFPKKGDETRNRVIINWIRMYRAIWNFFLISKFNVLYRAWEKESHNAFVLRGDPPSMRKRSEEISQWRRVEDMTRHVTRRWRSDMTHDTTMKTWYETWHDVKYVTHDVTLKTRVPLRQVLNNIYTCNIFFGRRNWRKVKLKTRKNAG